MVYSTNEESLKLRLQCCGKIQIFSDIRNYSFSRLIAAVIRSKVCHGASQSQI